MLLAAKNQKAYDAKPRGWFLLATVQQIHNLKTKRGLWGSLTVLLKLYRVHGSPGGPAKMPILIQ